MGSFYGTSSMRRNRSDSAGHRSNHQLTSAKRRPRPPEGTRGKGACRHRQEITQQAASPGTTSPPENPSGVSPAAQQDEFTLLCTETRVQGQSWQRPSCHAAKTQTLRRGRDDGLRKQAPSRTRTLAGRASPNAARNGLQDTRGSGRQAVSFVTRTAHESLTERTLAVGGGPHESGQLGATAGSHANSACFQSRSYD